MPEISIGMPYFERSAELRAGIAAFNRHGYLDGSYRHSVELSLVDDGSIREPLPLDNAFEKEYGVPAIVSNMPPKDHWDNPCIPLNRAVSQSTGKWILLQSPETIHRVDVLMAMMSMADGNPKVTVLCPVVSRDARAHLIWRCHPSRPDRLWFCQLVSRQLWKEAGGCDERFRGGGGSDDRALEYRLKKAGAAFKFLSDEYFAYHRKHEKAYRYKLNSNREKIKKLYGVPDHIKHKADLSEEEIERLGLENNGMY